MADHRARLRDRPVLVAVAVGLAVVELAIVSLLGPHNALASAPQVSAPAPYDVFHDLRWLAVYVPSWLAFVLALAVFFVARTAATAVLVSSAWPAAVARPETRELLRRAAWSTAILTLILVPWVVMLFATAVFSLSYLWIVAVPVFVSDGIPLIPVFGPKTTSAPMINVPPLVNEPVPSNENVPEASVTVP